MEYEKTKSVINESIRYYLDLNKNDYNSDMLFDEIFFLEVILRRYKKQISEAMSDNLLATIEERYNEINSLLGSKLQVQRNNLKKYSFYNQTQILFNLLGYFFITSNKEICLSDYEKAIITKSFGYSITFDLMMKYFIKKLNLEVNLEKAKFKQVTLYDKNNQIYIDTHYFLMESEYFLKECKNHNIDNLLVDYEYVMKNNLGDLISEIYWALNYFKCNDLNCLREIESYLEDKYNNGQWSFSYDDFRAYIHSQYSAIVSILELNKRRSEENEVI